jgi:hypothetical protein
VLCFDKRESEKILSNEDFDFWFLYILLCIAMGSLIVVVFIGG